MDIRNILLSHTDNIINVILTLPTAGLLKKHFPDAKIYFLGKSYTKPVIEACAHIDGFLDRASLMRKGGMKRLKSLGFDAIVHVFPDKEVARLASRAGIPVRIGTNHRLFHLLYCNKLVNLGRKNSTLHEAVLNMKLLKPLGIENLPELNEIPELYGIRPSAAAMKEKAVGDRFSILLHPKSKGSAREWPLQHYLELAQSLPSEQFQLYITGTLEEGERTREECPELFDYAKDMTGKFTLSELVDFIAAADAMVACSTGPLHLAAALGKYVVGIYPPLRPMHPGRWAPIGKHAVFLAENQPKCTLCKKTGDCACIRAITPEQVKNYLDKFYSSFKAELKKHLQTE